MSINDPRNPALRSRDLPWNDTPAAPTTPDPVKALLEVLGDPDHTEQCAHGVSEAGCIIEGLRERGYAISPAHSIEAEAHTEPRSDAIRAALERLVDEYPWTVSEPWENARAVLRDTPAAGASTGADAPPAEGDNQRRCWTIQGPDPISQCALYNGHEDDHDFGGSRLCGAPLGRGPATCMRPIGHPDYHEWLGSW